MMVTARLANLGTSQVIAGADLMLVLMCADQELTRSQPVELKIYCEPFNPPAAGM